MATPRFVFDGANFNLISSTITAVQKCAFVLYVGLCLINGTAFNFFNKYLIPDKGDKSWWPSGLFSFGNLDDCSSLWNIYLSHRCIKALLVIDDAEVLRAISGMSPFYKWHYLVIVRGSKVLVPYLFQFSLLLALAIMGILVLSAVTKVIQSFGIETPWARLLLQETSDSRRSSVIGLYHLAVIPGFLLVSYVVCNLAPVSDTKGCDNPWNMYCVTSLSRTVFKSKADSAFPSEKDIRFFATLGIFLSSVILTVLVYYATVFILCLGIYIAMDAVSSIWDTGYVLSENISRSSPAVIRSTWNQYMNQYMPNFKDLCFRLVQMERNNQRT